MTRVAKTKSKRTRQRKNWKTSPKPKTLAI
jgi:hypothetical protein